MGCRGAIAVGIFAGFESGDGKPGSMSAEPRSRRTRLWQELLLLVLILPIVVPITIVALVVATVKSVVLYLAIWVWWCGRGKDVLFVYSNSPLWRDRVMLSYLPLLDDRVVVLNWSERKRWRLSLAREAFYHFRGTAEFNPLAVQFRPLRPTKVFRFWRGFQDQKHGSPQRLQTVERDFFASVGLAPPTL